MCKSFNGQGAREVISRSLELKMGNVVSRFKKTLGKPMKEKTFGNRPKKLRSAQRKPESLFNTNSSEALRSAFSVK